jgi:hypothetical protein
VPDARYDLLVKIWKPVSEYPAYLFVNDIAGLVKGAAEGAGLGNAFLSHIQVSQQDRMHSSLRLFDGLPMCAYVRVDGVRMCACACACACVREYVCARVGVGWNLLTRDYIVTHSTHKLASLIYSLIARPRLNAHTRVASPPRHLGHRRILPHCSSV